MTVDQLKKDFPDVYNSIIQKGAKDSNDLVTAHITMGEAGNCMDLAIKNIKEGKEINNTVNAEYMAEGMKKRDVDNRLEDDDSTDNLGAGSDDSEVTEEETAEYAAELSKGMRGKKKNG